MIPDQLADTPCATVNPELFFPGTHDRWGVAEEAKAICGTCRSQTACLTYALADRNLCGIWGGTTEAERDKLRAS